jgi:hypothetical protein
MIIVMEDGTYSTENDMDLCLGDCYPTVEDLWVDLWYDDMYNQLVVESGADMNQNLSLKVWSLDTNDTVLMEIILTNGTSEIPLDQLAEGEYKAVLYSTDTTGIQYEMWTWFCIGSCWDDEDWDDEEWDDEDWNETNGTEMDLWDLVIGDSIIDVYIDQVNAEDGELLIVETVKLDPIIGEMVDIALGNGDGILTQDEADLFAQEIEANMDDEDWGGPIFELDGVIAESTGEAWINVEVSTDGVIVLDVARVWNLEMGAYDEHDSHILLVYDDEDDYDYPTNGTDYDENDCDGSEGTVWAHNGQNWIIESVDESSGAMVWTYDEYNDAWYSDLPCEKIDEVEFVLVKPNSDVDVPEETDDWEEIDTNLVPICSVAWYAINDDSTGETGTFVERAPESGLYEIEVASGAHYGIAFVCEDPEGEMMKLVIIGPNGVTTSESEGSADGWIVFAVPEGMGGEYEFSFVWNDGHNVETGYVVVSTDGDGSAGNLSENGTGLAGGVLPGFTSVLGISAMLGAAMVAARRKVA